MADFSTAAEIELEVSDQQLRQVRQQIESEIGATGVGVTDGGTPSAQATRSAASGRARRRRRRTFRLQVERNDQLDRVIALLDDIKEAGGGGGGGGGGILPGGLGLGLGLGSLASGGGGAAGGLLGRLSSLRALGGAPGVTLPFGGPMSFGGRTIDTDKQGDFAGTDPQSDPLLGAIQGITDPAGIDITNLPGIGIGGESGGGGDSNFTFGVEPRVDRGSFEQQLSQLEQDALSFKRSLNEELQIDLSVNAPEGEFAVGGTDFGPGPANTDETGPDTAINPGGLFDAAPSSGGKGGASAAAGGDVTVDVTNEIVTEVDLSNLEADLQDVRDAIQGDIEQLDQDVRDELKAKFDKIQRDIRP